MNITSAKYDENKDNIKIGIYATIDNKNVYIPISKDNRHYQAILEWAEEDGNEIQAAE